MGEPERKDLSLPSTSYDMDCENSFEYLVLNDSMICEDYTLHNLDSDSEYDAVGEDVEQIQVVSKEQVKEFTSKYLNGELTFSEYAAMTAGQDIEQSDVTHNLLLEDTVKINSNATFVSKPNEVKRNDTKRKRTHSKKKTGVGILPPALKGLMGEANVRCATGDRDTAIQLCLQVIREVPTAPEPFQTLAGLYDEQGDADKSLQMALIAAHLSSNDVNQWIHLAEKSQERGDIKQAITCYSKAIKVDFINIGLHVKREALLEQTGDKKTALKSYSKLLSELPPERGQDIMNISKMVAERYHEDKDIFRARDALEVAFIKCPELITSDYVNLFLELLIGLKSYKRCLEVMAAHCDLDVETNMITDQNISVLKCVIPEDTPIDLHTKLVIVLIHLHAFHLLDSLFKPILQLDPELAGDLYLDVVEALISEAQYHLALDFLTPLIQTENFCLPAVWLDAAKCKRKLGDLEGCVEAYLVVVKAAPHHSEARLAVSEVMKQLGRSEEAIEVLTLQEFSQGLDANLLYQRCLLLKDKPKRFEEFIASGQLLLSRHCIQIRSRDELYPFTVMQRVTRKQTVLKEIRTTRGEAYLDENAPKIVVGDKAPSIEEEWDIFWEMCLQCFKYKKIETLQRLAFSAQGSPVFTGYSQQLNLLCLMACFYNEDSYHCYNLARALIIKEIDCVRVWNLFNLVVLRAIDGRHNRFLMRLLIRNQAHPALTTLHANDCLVAGTYKYALNEYAALFRKDNSPLTALLLGITLTQMACQKFSAKKNSLVAQAIAFLWKYHERRGCDGLQEVHYNLGRCFHQLGLLPPAIFHYKRALFQPSPLAESHPQLFDLRREIAFNLHLIYLNSGSHDLARMCLEQSVVV